VDNLATGESSLCSTRRIVCLLVLAGKVSLCLITVYFKELWRIRLLEKDELFVEAYCAMLFLSVRLAPNDNVFFIFC